MADSAKNAVSDFKSLIPAYKTRRTVAFLYGFMFASLLVTVFFAFSPSSNSAAPWLTNFGSSSGYRSQVSSIVSFLFPNGTSLDSSSGLGFVPGELNSSRSDTQTRSDFKPGSSSNSSSVHGVTPEQSVSKNQTVHSESQLNQTRSSGNSEEVKVSKSSQTRSSGNSGEEGKKSPVNNQTTTSSGNSKANQSTNSGKDSKVNQTRISGNSESSNNQTQNLSGSSESKASKTNQTAELKPEKPKQGNQTANLPKSEKTPASNGTQVVSEKKKKSNGTSSGTSAGKVTNRDDSIESLRNCDLFDGSWVRDDSYKLYYKPGSCSLVDEQFNCVANGRPDLDFQKFKWKPKGCSIPRLDGKKMLEMLKGKRLVFVGDSLNRNMWESLICILMNSVKDRSRVQEVHGHHNFRADTSYSFLFKDYKLTVEFYVTPFIVKELNVDKGGSKKETLLLDKMSDSAEIYKNADVIVFNTGHWWTHEKTSKGEDYYQEGDKVLKQLNVLEAFRRAMSTWGRWVDKNINPKKSLVFFRGYSHSHFSGGQWNAGGACDSETVPIMNETFLRPYLKKMTILEQVLIGMKTNVNYLNVTKMTDFRKDAHPSIYRRQNAPEEERKSPLKYQDCSHWCLPGVPDTWNEVLYAKMLVKFGGQNKA